MAKISIYDIDPTPTLNDKVIGTSVAGPPDNNTNNFTLSDILTLFNTNTPLPLGRIKLSDPNQDYFNSLTSANAYVQSFTNATITDEYYGDNVYIFTVPYNSQFDLINSFCASADMSFEDPDGRVTSFGSGCFPANNKNNIFGDITFSNNFLINSLGDNVFGNVFADANFLNGSSGNNVMGNVTAGIDCLAYSSGNNIMRNISVASGFLSYSMGNNTIGNVTAGSDFLSYSSGNNTMNIISVGADAFNSAAPSVKNFVYQISSCGARFAAAYTNRMDVILFGSTGAANLPTTIFTTSNLAWIHTAWSNKYNNAGSIDGDIVNATANLNTNTSGQSTVIFD